MGLQEIRSALADTLPSSALSALLSCAELDCLGYSVVLCTVGPWIGSGPWQTVALMIDFDGCLLLRAAVRSEDVGQHGPLLPAVCRVIANVLCSELCVQFGAEA